MNSHLSDALADRYRIERELGAGGMATVYLAQDIKHGRKVAVKVLRQELAAALGHERFLREITTTANLRHPHILPLFDSGEAEGFVFYVMPLIEGESLRDRLTREGALPIADALRIADEVADALSYASRYQAREHPARERPRDRRRLRNCTRRERRQHDGRREAHDGRDGPRHTALHESRARNRRRRRREE
jgi:hypothetical protein